MPDHFYIYPAYLGRGGTTTTVAGSPPLWRCPT